jgi:hypothetical protein
MAAGHSFSDSSKSRYGVRAKTRRVVHNVSPANATAANTARISNCPMLTKHNESLLRAEPHALTTVGQPDFTVSRLHGVFFIIHAVRTRIPVCGTVVRHGPDAFSTPNPSSDLDW